MRPYTFIMSLGGAYFTFTGILSLLTSVNLVEPSSNIEFLVKGYAWFYSYCADSSWIVSEMLEWQFQYLVVGCVFWSSFLIFVLTDINNPYLPLSKFLITTPRRVLAWPLLFINIGIITYYAYRRGDFNKSQDDLSPEHYRIVKFQEVLWDYVKLTGTLAIGYLIYIGATM
ncbi:hypothetical protein H5162_20985 [Pseudoalteromonas sp. SR41-8]|uniref:hypothetical protein n=1 Tax=Pseudoalteromonas sp. SR41-8 TaxID=2760946 RepID=UPI001604103E|nr:hypothetical protein [Pseudoalteromonas sp. SR41-8]MBB1311886.1 hypothetical protein [Pseudoalteromonas sp. SR41-8]